MKRKLSILALAAAFSLPCKAQESSVAVEVENVKQSKVTVMASAGYAWRTAKIPSGTAYYLKNHFEKLTSGFNFDISAYHRIRPNMGLGLKFNRYSASAQTSPAGVYLSTKDRIIFIGPSFLYSNFERETPHKIYYDMAIGYVQYTSNTFVNTQKIENKGSALGLYSTIGYQYAVNRSKKLYRKRSEKNFGKWRKRRLRESFSSGYGDDKILMQNTKSTFFRVLFE